MSEIYSAPPKSRNQLRMLAKEIRKRFNLNDAIYFPVVKLLDVLTISFKGKFDYLVVEDSELPSNVHALLEFTDAYIVKIKKSVYEGAIRGKGRDRMTIAHEIAHFFLVMLYGVTFPQTKGKKSVKTFENPEWQAKCLAGEIMINKDLVSDFTAEEVMRQCGVSKDAAVYQLKIFHGSRTKF